MVSFLTYTERKSNKARMTDGFQQPCLTPSYLPTPRSRVQPEKLTGSQLVKKFPEFSGNRRFITAFTIARHLSLSWASYSLKRWKFCTLINRIIRYLHLQWDLLNDLQTYSYAAVLVTLQKQNLTRQSIFNTFQWVNRTLISNKILNFCKRQYECYVYRSKLIPPNIGISYMK
jgi:hypothetical protein